MHRRPSGSVAFVAVRGSAGCSIITVERRNETRGSTQRLGSRKRHYGIRFPTVVASWRRAWAQVIPFFAFPPDVRRVIYTTNALESVNARVRKIIKTRGHFPNDEAATKLIWLALRNITARWGGKASNYWHLAMQQFAILFEDRFTNGAS